MKLKIAILASNYIKIPPLFEDIPQGYSGAPEKIMSVITEGMVKKGHDVTLFASGDSQTNARLVSVTQHATAFDPPIDKKQYHEFEYLLISTCYRMAKEKQFDIIHSTFDTRSAYYSPLVATPTVSTLHSPLDDPVRQRILPHFANTQYYISISNAQRKPLPQLQYIQTIYHGIDTSAMTFSKTIDSDYMLFVGRIVPDKGIESGIVVAQKLKRKLYLIGSVNETSEFWTELVKPSIDNTLINRLGYIPKDEVNHFYQNAKLFLFPIQWEEPFGLVMIEAMACGTPVVAYARGSVPEVIKDGETGFIVNSSDDDIRGEWVTKKTGIDGLCEAVERIYAISENDYRQMRRNCRAHVEKNFTVERMVNNYEKVYQQILQAKK
jgi:glycosyltransferase involved in cell wall biosynthesis